eukprot:357218-Chlamydomonas_euryale.AAC.37
MEQPARSDLHPPLSRIASQRATPPILPSSLKQSSRMRRCNGQTKPKQRARPRGRIAPEGCTLHVLALRRRWKRRHVKNQRPKS